MRRIVSFAFVERRTNRVGVLERMGSSCGCSMMNNTAVFDAMLVDVFTGVPDWTRQTGVPGRSTATVT